MSRYTLRDDDSYEVTVGWDNQLGTFFAHVKDKTVDETNEEQDPVVVWEGWQPSEIVDPTKLGPLITNYAVIPEEITTELLDDMANRREPTEFQRETFRRVTGKELP